MIGNLFTTQVFDSCVSGHLLAENTLELNLEQTEPLDEHVDDFIDAFLLQFLLFTKRKKDWK